MHRSPSSIRPYLVVSFKEETREDAKALQSLLQGWSRTEFGDLQCNLFEENTIRADSKVEESGETNV